MEFLATGSCADFSIKNCAESYKKDGSFKEIFIKKYQEFKEILGKNEEIPENKSVDLSEKEGFKEIKLFNEIQ